VKCDLVDRRVGAFVDGELDPASMLDVERHVEVCGRCQEIIGFERRFRSLVSDSLAGIEVPDSLRSRLSRDLDGVDVRGEAAVLRRRSLQVFVAAASLTLIVGIAHQSRTAQLAPLVAGGVEGIQGVTPVFDDVLTLPADVRAQAPSEVSQFFRDKVSFPVTPAAFDGGEARLTGARLQPMGARTAAALHYDVGGRRVTVFVVDGDVPELGEQTPEGAVVLRNVGGQTVPVRRHGNLTYVFTGDVERETLVRLAKTARVSH
jgi:anti-sigma factor RsiW